MKIGHTTLFELQIQLHILINKWDKKRNSTLTIYQLLFKNRNKATVVFIV